MSQKRQLFTRKKLHRLRAAERLEAKQQEKAARKHAASAQRKEDRVEAAFRGIDPGRTERLVDGTTEH